jgi:hypothetical protein
MSEEQPPHMVGMDGRPAGIRTFKMNSREFYEAVTQRPGPWRWGPGIGSQTNSESPLVIIEHSLPLPFAGEGRLGGAERGEGVR